MDKNKIVLQVRVFQQQIQQSKSFPKTLIDKYFGKLTDAPLEKTSIRNKKRDEIELNETIHVTLTQHNKEYSLISEIIHVNEEEITQGS